MWLVSVLLLPVHEWSHDYTPPSPPYVHYALKNNDDCDDYYYYDDDYYYYYDNDDDDDDDDDNNNNNNNNDKNIVILLKHRYKANGTIYGSHTQLSRRFALV